MGNKFYQTDNNGNLIIGGVLAQDIVAKFIEYIDSETLSVVENKLLSYKPKEMVEDCKYYIYIKLAKNLRNKRLI